MAIIISDAGPLIALAQINALHLLDQLFGQVQIPDVVMQECLAKQGADTEIIQQAIEDNRLNVINVNVEHEFPRTLGKGECAAMQLALKNDQSLLIIDDQLARRYAIRLKLNFIGTVKILTLAERKGVISSAEKSLLSMIENGYRVSSKFLG